MNKKRTYSVYARRHGDWNWVRLSGMAFVKPTAVRVFQSLLLEGSLKHGLEMKLGVAEWEGTGMEYPMLGSVSEGEVRKK
jgi:hypothetical protein